MAEKDDPKQAEQENAKQLTDEELEAVAGGAAFAPQPEPPKLLPGDDVVSLPSERVRAI